MTTLCRTSIARWPNLSLTWVTHESKKHRDKLPSMWVNSMRLVLEQSMFSVMETTARLWLASVVINPSVTRMLRTIFQKVCGNRYNLEEEDGRWHLLQPAPPS